ncbi:MAG: 1-acyl-sn-glycerol-3-phosphate acyltransferase [Oceanospirillum sp.]|nr:1-acyl-sn-glycerol-3-phosphate acyltransferase [Oceanospirillum sp.]
MNTVENDTFKEIRPYYDHEVHDVVQEVINNPELISAICQFRFPQLHQSLGFILRPLIRRKLKSQFANINRVDDFQSQIASYMNRMIRNSTDGFTVSGLDKLDKTKPYLLVANHRDIAMDPAFVNYALYQAQRDTVRIAIGDNLLQKPYISDLMRLNKSFIVKRSAKGVREMMKALTQLSGYINYSLLEEQQSIWIAQKEGRAKDGIDLTDPAIIKMFYMSRKKKGSGPTFSEVINELNIVPVTISYEYDPCDEMKARELNALATEGSYNKVEFEDIDSIVKGISGHKGRVHVHFDQPLSGEFANADEAAAQIDRQIWDNYCFYPSNWLALEQLGGYEHISGKPLITDQERSQFEQRLQGIPEALRPYVLKMYANPILNSRGLIKD